MKLGSVRDNTLITPVLQHEHEHKRMGYTGLVMVLMRGSIAHCAGDIEIVSNHYTELPIKLHQLLQQ